MADLNGKEQESSYSDSCSYPFITSYSVELIVWNEFKWFELIESYSTERRIWKRKPIQRICLVSLRENRRKSVYYFTHFLITRRQSNKHEICAKTLLNFILSIHCTLANFFISFSNTAKSLANLSVMKLI